MGVNMRKLFSSIFFLTAVLCSISETKIHGSDLSLTGEYLFWTAQQRDMEFMRTGKDTDTGFPGSDRHFDKVHEPNYDWKSGFRVGLRYTLDECECNCFRPSVEYTHFRTKGKKSAFATRNRRDIFQGTPSLPPTIPPSSEDFYVNGVPTVSEGHSRINLNVDYVDLTLFGEENCCCDCFHWNWNFGVRGAILKNTWRTDYLIQLRDDLKIGTELAPQKVKINWRYEGLGLLLNGSGAYEITCGFRLYQDVTGALLLGKMKTYSKAKIKPSFTDTVDICNIRNAKYKIVPVVQSETGIDWIYCFESGYGVRVNVAFEYGKWFNVAENNYYTIPQAARFKDSCVDIDLYGLTTGITFVY